MNKPFFHKSYVHSDHSISIDKIPNDDLCSVRYNTVVEYSDDKTIIRKDRSIVNLTRKVNETAKALKAQNADLIAKMNKLFESEINS